MTDSKQRIISIRSSDRKNGTIGDFITSITQMKNIHFIQFQDAIIPMSHYMIDSLNDTVQFQDPVQRSIQLTHGFYTQTEFVNELKSKMDAISTLTYTITINNISDKMTISSTANFTLDFDKNNNPALTMGFTKTPLSGASSYTAPNLFNLSRRYQIFNVYSNKIVRHHQHVHSSSKKSQLLCVMINSTAPPKSYLHYTHDSHSNMLIKYDPNDRIRDIDIQIRDIDDNLIEFNGVDEVVFNFIVFEK